MNKQWIALILLILALLITGIFFADKAKWQTKEIEMGLSHQAKQDPLLVARLFLQMQDKQLTTLSNKAEFLRGSQLILPKDSSFIVDEAAYSEFPGLSKALLRWVRNGGHLIYLTSPAIRQEKNIQPNSILKTTEVQISQQGTFYPRYSVKNNPSDNAALDDGLNILKLKLPTTISFDHCQAKAITAEETEQSLVCETDYEKGSVTYISTLGPISNSGIRHLDHGAYLLWLIGENTQMYYLPSLKNPNWLVALWYWSWQTIVISILLLALAMWTLAIHLGLPRTPLASSRISFAEHIKAAGIFMIKHNHHQVLKDALVKDIQQSIERRQPNFKHLPRGEQAKVIAKLTNIEPELIEKLLSDPLPHSEQQRLHSVKLFKELRDKL